ncbi:MAG: polysaccharide biosynthesis/export family protein [Ginsengibacter sp.]
MRKVILPLLFVCVTSFLVTSCANTKKIVYFNNVPDGEFKDTKADRQTPIQPNDILSITVSSLNAEASAPFNLQNNNISRATTVTGSNNESGGYLVNTDGSIDLPILGAVQAAGLTKEELKTKITNLILSKRLLIGPIVDIRYLNYEVTVIGEVARPTVITVPNEKISLLKAIGLAGDLTIYGKRDNVLLIREENGKKITRHINLSSSDFFNSPYYYLKPNDVIYVQPNATKAATASRSTQYLPIVFSALTIVAIILDRIIR